MKPKSIILPIFYFSLFLFLGCSKQPATETLPLNEAHKKLIQLCKEEYKTNIVIKLYPNTVWIYLPVEENFMQIKANDEGPKTSNEAKESKVINFLEGKYEDGLVKMEYDITLSKTYSKEYGYGNTFTEKYQNQQRDILTAITRIYTQVEETGTKDSAKPQEKTPDFFIIVGADIVNGIETQMTFVFQDLKRAMMDSFFQEEYTKRNVMDYPKGNTKIIGDRQGKHLETYDMTWPQFLTKQIIHRIHSKYERSAFPPAATDDDQKEILKIVAETINAYDFKDFPSIELNDLHNTLVKRVEKSELQKFIDEDAAAAKGKEGKFIEIHFK